MKTFETALEDIYARANDIQIAEKRRNKRIMKIATSCASICIIFVVALAVIRPFDDKTTEDGRVVLEGKNGNKKWITDIPGAVYLENPEYFSDEIVLGDICTPKQLVTHLRISHVIIGDAENFKSFYIESGSYTWNITTFDIKVSKVVNGTFETEVLKCVTKYDYLTGSNPHGFCAMTNVGLDTIENPSGLFTVRSVYDEAWNINGETYKVSDFADYYINKRIDYDYEFDGISWGGDFITLEEIKGAQNLPAEPKFYYRYMSHGIIKRKLRPEDGFARIEDEALYGESEKVVSSDKINTTKSLDGLGTFTYKESKIVKNASDSNGIYRVYDTYVSEDGSKEVTFLEGTDIMTWYNDNSSNKDKIGKKIDLQQAKKIATEFISKHLNGYSIEGMAVSGISTKNFVVSFTREVEGFSTNEALHVSIDEYGRVCRFDAPEILMYDEIEGNITYEKISAAKKLLADELDTKNFEYIFISDETLICGYNGNLYLYVYITMKIDGDYYNQAIYIPI